MGVGFNTPTIIRFPFEKLVREHNNISLVRLNLDQAIVPGSFGKRAVGINADMAISIRDIVKDNMMEKDISKSIQIYKEQLAQKILEEACYENN